MLKLMPMSTTGAGEEQKAIRKLLQETIGRGKKAQDALDEID